jgi:hypothetical protein
MTQARNHQRTERILSTGSHAGHGAIDLHNYPPQTLFEQVKEKKVNYILNLFTKINQICYI